MSYQTSSKRSPPFCLLIGQKNTKVFWHQSEARTIPTVWNWSGKTLSPGALLAVFHFLSPHYLPLGLRGWFKRCKLRERVARNGHHDYGIGSGAGAVENAVDLSTAFFPLLSWANWEKSVNLAGKGAFEIRKRANFKSDMLKTNEVITPQSCEIYRRLYGGGLVCAPQHTNVCKISRFEGARVLLTLMNQSQT